MDIKISRAGKICVISSVKAIISAEDKSVIFYINRLAVYSTNAHSLININICVVKIYCAAAGNSTRNNKLHRLSVACSGKINIAVYGKVAFDKKHRIFKIKAGTGKVTIIHIMGNT